MRHRTQRCQAEPQQTALDRAHVVECKRDYLDHGIHEAEEAKAGATRDLSAHLEFEQALEEVLLLHWRQGDEELV